MHREDGLAEDLKLTHFAESDGLAIGLAGAPQDPQDVHDLIPAVRSEEDAVIADAAAENALPLVAVERLHIALERVGGHLGKNAADPLLDWLREVL